MRFIRVGVFFYSLMGPLSSSLIGLPIGFLIGLLVCLFIRWRRFLLAL